LAADGEGWLKVVEPPSKDAPQIAQRRFQPIGRRTDIRTASGGNQAVFHPLSPLVVPLLLRPRLGSRRWAHAGQQILDVAVGGRFEWLTSAAA
jgi:hypothetical protein